MTSLPNWEQHYALLHHLNQVAEAARKAAQALKKQQVKPTNRIRTLEAQRHELDKTTAAALFQLDRYTRQLRARLEQESNSTDPEDHPGALPSGASDRPRRNPEMPQ